MATNNNKFNYFGIVINAPKEKATNDQASDFFNGVLTYLKDYNKIKFYASAIHDKDIHEDGTPKTIHQHIQVETFEKYTNLTFLKEFCNAVNIDKGLVSLNGSNNLFLLVQYLTHKNQSNKTQYDYSVIKTNNAEELANLYNADYESREDIILRALSEKKTIAELMQAIGVIDANKYRNLFKDLKMEQNADLESVITRLDKIRADYDSLLRYTSILLETLRNGLKDHEKRIINFAEFDKSFSVTFKR